MRDFYALRIARIAPLLVLVLTVLSALHLAGLKNFIVSPKVGGLGRALLAALTFHVNVLEAGRGYLPANWDILWSLSVEEMFYLFFPVACRVLRSRKPFIGLLLLFIGLGPIGRTVLAQGNDVWREYSYLGGMDAIAWGCLTALLVSRIPFSRAALWGLGRAGIDMTILPIGTCMIMIAAAQTDWTAPHLMRPLLAMGERSYEIYLTHMFVVFAFFELFLQAEKPLAGVPLLFIAVLLVSVLAGMLTARLFSEPMNRRLRKVFGQDSNRLASVIAAPSVYQ